MTIRSGHCPSSAQGLDLLHGLGRGRLRMDALHKQQMVAAAFARSIGLRDYSAFTALIEGGHIAATQVKSLKTTRLQWLMSDAEIADIRERFVAPTMITQETGLHRNTIFAVFSAAGVKPFQPAALEAGPIYPRRVAMRAISNHQEKR